MPIDVNPCGLTNDGVYRLDMAATAGDTWTLEMAFTDDGTPMNFTGCAAKCVVADSAGSAVVTFDSEATVPTITLGGTAGTLVMSQTAVTTAALTAGVYEYDLQVTEADGAVTTYLRGEFRVVAEVTTDEVPA